MTLEEENEVTDAHENNLTDAVREADSSRNDQLETDTNNREVEDNIPATSGNGSGTTIFGGLPPREEPDSRRSMQEDAETDRGAPQGIADSEVSSGKLTGKLVRALITCIGLYDMLSDWIQCYNYQQTYKQEMLLNASRHETGQSCKNLFFSLKDPFIPSSSTTDDGTRQTEVVYNALDDRTFRLYLMAAVCGSIIQLLLIFLKWNTRGSLPRALKWCKSYQLPDSCSGINKLAKTSQVKNESLMEVLLMQLVLLLEDLPATIANIAVAYKTCTKDADVGIFLIISASGSALSAFHMLWVYSLHVFFVVFPNCFCGLVRQGSWTLAKKALLYPFIVLLTVIWYCSFGAIWVIFLGFWCTLSCEWASVCFCCCCSKRDHNKRNQQTLALFLRGLVLVLALGIFLYSIAVMASGIVMYNESNASDKNSVLLRETNSTLLTSVNDTDTTGGFL